MSKPIGLLFSLLWITGPVFSQRLTLPEIMQGEDFTGVSPSEVRWNGDASLLFFEWKPPGEKEKGTYVIRPDGTGLRRLSEAEEKEAWPEEGVWDRQRNRYLSERDGDIVLFHRDGRRDPLTRTRESETDPRFNREETGVYFTRENNLFLLSLTHSTLEQITDFRPGPAPAEKDLSPSREFLKKQQEELFEEFSGEKKEQQDKENEKQKEKDARAFYYSDGEKVSRLRMSPDGRFVLFELTIEDDNALKTQVPHFVTESGYTKDTSSRTKVGDSPETSRLGIYEVKTGTVRWVPEEGSMAEVSEPRWNEAGNLAAVLMISNDYKDRWIYRIEPESGGPVVLDHLRDEAWIGGPLFRRFGWMPDGNHVYFVSEQDGWAHLYVVDQNGENRRQLTSGQWEVRELVQAGDGSHWFMATSEVHPGEEHFYRMPINGGERTRLTRRSGRHEGILSPDDRQLAVLYSPANHPTELYVQPAEPDSEPKQLTRSTPEAFQSYSWQIPEILQIPARDGAAIYGRYYEPEEPAPGRPAVIFVHGAGYLQNAHKWWSRYYREYLFHHFLMEQGYAVLDLDYRGSAGYGRDWRTGIHRHMGGTDLSDQLDGARWLIQEKGVDAKRIGIYGGSYGGFITLMAMFTEPGVFAAGAALRPVTDWAHYNHGYTSRILNVPQEDAEAYRRSSPIYFAEGLEGSLLICHGMRDDNVHFQDTVRLVQRLIELGKENWEVAIYPVEDHAFENPTSWTDEYRRIFKLFEANLK